LIQESAARALCCFQFGGFKATEQRGVVLSGSLQQYAQGSVPLIDSILRALVRQRIAERPIDFSQLPAYRAEYFPDSGPKPWLDRDGWPQQIEDLPVEQAALCRQWAETGYVILPKLIPESLLDTVWQAYEQSIQRGIVTLAPESAADGDRLPGRFLNPHKRVRPFCRVAKHPELLNWLQRLLGHPVKLLQTIASHKGSQQAAHSDSIHMTTYPLGYLAAAWIAFEDIHPDCGPLEFYPGSHRLPYVFSRDLQISVDDMKNEGYTTYRARYEPFVKGLIAEHRLRPDYFEARKGDALIWHANLLHGGSQRRDLRLTRKALVGHYFARGAFVYHDLSAVPSRQQYLGGCLVR
jgi:hypothetical protein